MLCLLRNLPFKVHQALCLPQNLHFEVHHALCLRRNLHFEVHKVLRLPRNLHFEVDKVMRLPRNPQASHMSKSHDSLHLSRNLSSSTITTMSKVLRLPRKLHIEVKQLRSLAPVTKSRLVDFGAPKLTRFPLHLPRKVTTMSENARGATTRAQSRQAPAAGTQIFGSLRSRNALGGFREA